MTRFGARLEAAMDTFGPLCAGIDPHAPLLQRWGLTDDVDGLRAFADICVEAFAGHVAAVKPQSAFFERHGSGGVKVLEDVVAAFARAGTLCILDVKRGDIGSTMAAYADAYAGPGSALAGDATTVSPYLGFGSLAPLVDLALAGDRGVFVLALTSNPEGPAVQHARGADGRSVAGTIVDEVAALNRDRLAAQGASTETGLGDIGLVVGATIGDAVGDLGIDLAASRAPLLAPGVGAQGAGGAELRRVFGDALPQVLASSSREVLAAGPDPAQVRAAAERTAATCATELGRR